jgi:hypothetical protein
VLFIAILMLIVLIRKSLIVWQLFVAKVETVGAPIASLPVNASTNKHLLALSMRLSSGNKICPLAWQNCSTTAADSWRHASQIDTVFQGGWLPFSGSVWQPDSIETGGPPMSTRN